MVNLGNFHICPKPWCDVETVVNLTVVSMLFSSRKLPLPRPPQSTIQSSLQCPLIRSSPSALTLTLWKNWEATCRVSLGLGGDVTLRWDTGYFGRHPMARASQATSVVKNLPASVGHLGLISGSERSPGGGNGNPLQYSCLENSTDRRAWWAAVHGSQREMTEQLSMYHGTAQEVCAASSSHRDDALVTVCPSLQLISNLRGVVFEALGQYPVPLHIFI